MPYVIFDMPMDEATNSPIAYDYSIYANHGQVHNATFVPGHDGYAAHFTGTDYIMPHNPIPDLAIDFTLIFWVKAIPQLEYSNPGSLLFQFAFSDQSIVQYQSTEGKINQWQSVALVKYADGAKVYIDGQLKGSMVFTAGTPIEWAIKQSGDNNGFPYTLPMTFGANTAPYALGDIDNVLIYNAALTPEEINEAIAPHRKVFYKIDGIPFEDYDVYVSASTGVLDALELKEPTTVDWAGEHGQIVDLERPRYKPRQIELDCFISGGNYLTFTTKFDQFIKLFQKPGLHRLKIEIDSRKPLLYEVYLPLGTENDKKWRIPDTAGNFKLKLIDPQPIRRILRFTPTEGNLGIAKIRFTCYEAMNIYWGDGTNASDIIADDDLLISHTFTAGKPYYEIIITGEVNNITNFSHNCIIIWTRL